MADQLVPIPEVPSGLKEAARRGILIPFIGAGASLVAGCPGWVALADGVLTELIKMGKFSYSQFDQIKHLNPRVKLSLARAIETENGVSINYRSLLHPVERQKH